PQNRVTESAIFSAVAEQFGIGSWPVAALKSYLGHSIACSGADQLVMTLGVWQHGIIPGILTTGELAEDVSTGGLDFLLKHKEVDPLAIDSAILNAKGFGGNNATASLLPPPVTRRMLEKRHGKAALSQWQKHNETVAATSSAYQQQCSHGHITPIYHYDHDVRDGGDIELSAAELKLRG